MARLNGWQRLWVLACVAMLTIMVPILEAMPTPGKISEFHDFEAERIQERIDVIKTGDAARIKFDNDNVGFATQEGLQAALAANDQQLVDKLDTLRIGQLMCVLQALATWLAACIALYLTGWIVGWLYRGFRPSRSSVR